MLVLHIEGMKLVDAFGSTGIWLKLFDGGDKFRTCRSR